jgi:hypothetical protein
METEIPDEIRKVRDEHAKECAYDVHRAFEQMSVSRLKGGKWLIALFPALWCGKSLVRATSSRSAVKSGCYEIHPEFGQANERQNMRLPIMCTPDELFGIEDDES